MNLYKGTIVSIDSDEEKRGVIKCTVDGLYNSANMGNIDLDSLPKLYPLYSGTLNDFSTPKMGEEVFVVLNNGNKYSGFWFGKYSLSDDFLQVMSDRYEGFKSIKYDEEEKLRCYYSRDRGLFLELDDSRIKIFENEIFLETPDRKLHILDGMISLGALEKSAEPATLGDKNVDALNQISDELEKLSTEISKFCITQSNVTKNVSYLSPLTPAYDVLNASAISIIAKIKSQIKAMTIPKTLSKKTSLD